MAVSVAQAKFVSSTRLVILVALSANITAMDVYFFKTSKINVPVCGIERYWLSVYVQISVPYFKPVSEICF